MKRKGIILAGGLGTRLMPSTKAVSKQIIPIFDKPMIYYSLSTLMLSGIQDILLISTPRDIKLYKNLFSDISLLGIKMKFKTQNKPNGIAESFIIAENFLKNSPCALILGDNFFFGDGFQNKLKNANNDVENATLFAYYSSTPELYGVINFKNNEIKSITEKPKKPKSNYIVTGLYFYPNSVIKTAKLLKPSKRNELEISDLNNAYIKNKKICLEYLGRGFSWFDTGSHQDLLSASNFVSAQQSKLGLMIGSIEEIAYRKKYINLKQLHKLSKKYSNSSYGNYLSNLL